MPSKEIKIKIEQSATAQYMQNAICITTKLYLCIRAVEKFYNKRMILRIFVKYCDTWDARFFHKLPQGIYIEILKERIQVTILS